MDENEKIELTPQEWLSPSSINTWFKCPRGYFYNYIAKLPVKPSIHLIKGSIVHKVLEDFFKVFPKETTLESHIFELFKVVWQKSDKQIKMLDMSQSEVLQAKLDCLSMVKEYFISFERKINNLISSGKAENEQHAYYLLKPKLKELFVKDEDLKCRGYIDRVHTDYDGNITLGDYKTSSKFGIGLSEDYKRQLSIYGLLYKSQEKIMAHYVAVIFLRYGEEYFLEVTPSLLDYARATIVDVYNKTRSVDIKDYYKKESKLCNWCDYQDVCSGKENWEEQVRKEILKKLMKKESKNESGNKTNK